MFEKKLEEDPEEKNALALKESNNIMSFSNSGSSETYFVVPTATKKENTKQLSADKSLQSKIPIKDSPE